jgi:hypothetical protein
LSPCTWSSRDRPCPEDREDGVGGGAWIVERGREWDHLTIDGLNATQRFLESIQVEVVECHDGAGLGHASGKLTTDTTRGARNEDRLTR